MCDESYTLSVLPWPLTDSNCASLRNKLLKNCSRLAPSTQDSWKPLLPDKDLRFLLERAINVLEREPTVVDVALTLNNPQSSVETIAPGVTVVQAPSALLPPSALLSPSEESVPAPTVEEGPRICVVGDIHGQVFDLCAIIERISNMEPPIHTVVFTGDYVDRGSWGVECLIALLTLKLRGVQAPGVRIQRSRSPSPSRKGFRQPLSVAHEGHQFSPQIPSSPPPSLSPLSHSFETPDRHHHHTKPSPVGEGQYRSSLDLVHGSFDDESGMRAHRNHNRSNSICQVEIGARQPRHSRRKKEDEEGESHESGSSSGPTDEQCDEHVRNLVRAARHPLAAEEEVKPVFVEEKTDTGLFIRKAALQQRPAGVHSECSTPVITTTQAPFSSGSSGSSTPDVNARKSRSSKVKPFPNVVLLRGNHESSSCINTYGFAAEVKSKYSLSMLPLFRKLFAAMPLAAVARCGHASSLTSDSQSAGAGSGASGSYSGSSCGSGSNSASGSPSLPEPVPVSLVSPSASSSSLSSVSSHRQKLSKGVIMVHGGLWRSRADVRKAAAAVSTVSKSPSLSSLSSPTLSPTSSGPIQVGQLKELRALNRTRYEDAVGTSIVADLLWSDPAASPGVTVNARRAMSITYGPDASASFLKSHRLVMLIRSHEGPDARDKRKGEMPSVDSGYSIDHHWPDSEDPSVVTVFSAPAYPQFKSTKKESGRNTRGAYAVLKPVELPPPDDLTGSGTFSQTEGSTDSPEKKQHSGRINVKWNISFVEFDAEPRPPGIKYPHL